RLLATLHEPLELDGLQINLAASGGIAVAPCTGGMGELLRRADVAMYQAKRSGQRVVTYTGEGNPAESGPLSHEGDLRRIVAAYEFEIDFQPIVDLGTGEVIAAEAQARWQHPDRGRIDPLHFLETVDRTDLLPAFTEAVLDRALCAA